MPHHIQASGHWPFRVSLERYKSINSKQRSRLQSDSSEMQLILYGSARMDCNKVLGVQKCYDWADIDHDMGLEDFNHVDHDRNQCRVRVFKAWIEDWERRPSSRRTQWKRGCLWKNAEHCASLMMRTNTFTSYMTKTWSSRGKLQGQETKGGV